MPPAASEGVPRELPSDPVVDDRGGEPATRRGPDADDGPVGLVRSGPSVTWLGHATAVAELRTGRVVFDPLLPWRARRAGRVDAVLVTHSHVDHLNRWSLKAIDRDTHLVVPRGAKHVVADLGFREVTEVSPGDQLSVAGLEISAVETRHDQGRWRKSRSPEALGFVVAQDGVAVHHAGDVDFSDHSVFDDIGKRFSLAASLLPIGGMMPVWYYRWRRKALDRGIHIDPDAALDIYERLGARTLVPVHWGTVHLPFSPAAMAKKRLVKMAAARKVGGVEILDHGQALALRP